MSQSGSVLNTKTPPDFSTVTENKPRLENTYPSDRSDPTRIRGDNAVVKRSTSGRNPDGRLYKREYPLSQVMFPDPIWRIGRPMIVTRDPYFTHRRFTLHGDCGVMTPVSSGRSAFHDTAPPGDTIRVYVVSPIVTLVPMWFCTYDRASSSTATRPPSDAQHRRSITSVTYCSPACTRA